MSCQEAKGAFLLLQVSGFNQLKLVIILKLTVTESHTSSCCIVEWPHLMGCSSSIIQASTIGDVDQLVKLLKKNSNVECTNADGCSPLFLACREGHISLVPHLLNAQANPNIPNKQGFTPLHAACEAGHRDVVRLLLQHGADPSSSDPQGRPALVIASANGNADVVIELLAGGAEVELGVRYRTGCTSLHCAAQGGHAEAVSALLAGGANALVKDDNGLTPLHIGTVSFMRDYLHVSNCHNNCLSRLKLRLSLRVSFCVAMWWA